MKPGFHSIEFGGFVLDLDFDAKHPERMAAEPSGENFEAVLLGRDPQQARMVEIVAILRCIHVVISKATLDHDPGAQRFERSPNRSRTSHARQETDPPTA